MTKTISNQELRRNAAEFITRHAGLLSRGAWPHFGKDLVLVEEDGPVGSLLISCHTDESLSNPMGMVHGGVVAALVDACMGLACMAQCGMAPAPTVTMTVNYARPVPLDADILVRAHTVRVGRTSGQMSAEVFLPDRPEEILVTSTGVYAVKR